MVWTNPILDRRRDQVLRLHVRLEELHLRLHVLHVLHLRLDVLHVLPLSGGGVRGGGGCVCSRDTAAAFHLKGRYPPRAPDEFAHHRNSCHLLPPP